MRHHRAGRLVYWHDVDLGAPWRVYLTRWIRRFDGAELAGLTLLDRRRIYVRADTLRAVRETYAHEVLHALFASVGCAKGDDSLEERLVRAAEPAFARLLRVPPLPEPFRGLLTDEED